MLPDMNIGKRCLISGEYNYKNYVISRIPHGNWQLFKYIKNIRCFIAEFETLSELKTNINPRPRTENQKQRNKIQREIINLQRKLDKLKTPPYN